VKTIRSFIAIALTDQARDEITLLQGRLEEVVPNRTVRWTAPQNIHLTLHFLGDVSVDHLEAVGQALTDVTAGTQPFSLALKNLGCFPNIARPRIVWVGLSGATDILVALQRELGQQLNKAIDFQPESRPYSPHLTIGRVRKGIPQRGLRDLGQALEKEMPRVGEVAPLPVHTIHLIRSDLKPDGPVYSTLASGKLG
jgi:2'-5' RNA ligase